MGQNRLNLGKLVELISQSSASVMISLHGPCSSTGGKGTGVWSVIGCLCCSFLLILCPWSSTHSFPQETTLHKPLQSLSHGLQFFRWISLLCGPPWAAGAQLPHHELHYQLQRNLLAELFPSHILSPVSWLMLHNHFFSPFLNTLPQRHCCRHWWAQPWLATGPSRSWLALTLSDVGEACGSYSQKTLL